MLRPRVYEKYEWSSCSALSRSITLAVMEPPLIYHICRRDEWTAAEAAGSYSGSSQDRADGFIHFSAAAQVAASAARPRAGPPGLELLTVEARPDAPRLGKERVCRCRSRCPPIPSNNTNKA